MKLTPLLALLPAIAMAAPLLDGAVGNAVAPGGALSNIPILGDLAGVLGGLGGLGNALGTILQLPGDAVNAVVKLLQQIAQGGIPVTLPPGLPSSLTSGQIDQIKGALSTIPNLDVNHVIGQLTQVIPVVGVEAHSAVRVTAKRSGSVDPSIGNGLDSILTTVVKGLLGFDPHASVAQVVADLNTLQGQLDGVLAGLHSTPLGDQGTVIDAVGQLVNYVATYLKGITNPTDPGIQKAAQGVTSTLTKVVGGVGSKLSDPTALANKLGGITDGLGNATGLVSGLLNALKPLLSKLPLLGTILDGLLSGNGLGGIGL